MSQKLEIIFYGMACFDPVPGQRAYRVLFPNGLNAKPPVPEHRAGIWVRDRDKLATAKWAYHSIFNDFYLDKPRSLTIDGLASSQLAVTDFEDRVTVLTKANPKFKVSNNPNAVIDMTVDRGTLSAHEFGTKGMIVVRWEVERTSGPVRFNFGDNFVEVPADADQAILFNAGVVMDTGQPDPPHFDLFAQVSTDPAAKLNFEKPAKNPKPPVNVKDPTIKYSLWTPDIMCSPVLTELSGWA